MAYNNNITVGSPPLLWSELNDAFTKVNENFDILSATMGGAGLVPVDFGALDSDVTPASDNLYKLGDASHRWKSIRTASFLNTDPDLENGVWIGPAHITNQGSTITLPNESTVNGSLIIDPDKTFFKIIDVDNGNSIVAQSFGDTVKFLSGTGTSMIVDSAAESITFNNDGILSVSSGSGISVSTVNGAATITNTGVRSLTSTTSLPSGRTAGAGINIDNPTGEGIKITNTGVISIISGVGITVSSDPATGQVQIINSAPGGNVYSGFLIDSDYANIIQADNTSDTVSFNSGTGITLDKNPTTDTITFSVNPYFDLTGNVTGDLTGNVTGNLTGNVTGNVTGDIKGSVFGDDSSILVDAVSNYIFGNVSATTLRTAESKIALGSDAGKTAQSTYAVAIGQEAGKTSQGSSAVSVGYLSGNVSQGDQAVAIGYQAGTNTQGTSGIAIGFEAGKTSQSTYGISIGHIAGEISQGIQAVAIGTNAGQNTQGGIAVAIGTNAGESNQGSAGVAIGYYAGKTTQETGAVAIGYTTGQITQRQGAVAIGWSAGQTNQGANAIAIGYRAGFTNQNASSIVLNASGVALEAAAAGFFVNPIRSTANGTPLMYNTSTSELFYSSVLEFIGSKISTSDSSGITVDVVTTFNTDVVAENDVIIRGSRVINLAELKSVVAASSSFADFQTKIAALV